MSTVDDSAEQHSFAAGTHWSQQSELTSGEHSSGRQRTPGDHQGRHRRSSDKCSARHATGTGPDDPKDTGIHDCIDLEGHSAECHLCSCGLIWRAAE